MQGVRLLALAPAPVLARYVHGYWFTQDLPGVYEGRPIRTSPHPGAVLSVNFGRPNAMVGGPLVPRVSLLGLQTVARQWRSWSETYFVMVMLSVEGLARLFPGLGREAVNRLLDLGGELGDRGVRLLADDLDAAWVPERIRHRLDRWLAARLDAMAPPAGLERMAAALRLLDRGGSVQDAAAAVEVSRRQFHRWTRGQTGLGPQQLADLGRMQASLRAVQSGQGDPLAGFSDQAHQIRNWRRRLGVTPGAYGRAEPSILAAHFAGCGAEAPAFYL